MSDEGRDEAERTRRQAELFSNRLDKQWKHLKKWAKRTEVSAWRLYDRDIPEIPLAVDVYVDCTTACTALHIALYDRPYEKDEAAEELWMAAMKEVASRICAVPLERVYTKIRKKQRGEDSQYEKIATKPFIMTVREGEGKFLVNLSSYVDTGLFLDHRPGRALVGKNAKAKRVLNLFCYTGAFSIHAALGGASSVTSVDLSKTYLSWAVENFRLNGLEAAFPSPDKSKWRFIHSDVRAFLEQSKKKGERWDTIVCDPPTFSNSKRSPDTFDVNRDWLSLCQACLSVLAAGGTLYFSTNSRSLKFDGELLMQGQSNLSIQDISEASIPEDFRNKKIHRMWTITMVKA